MRFFAIVALAAMLVVVVIVAIGPGRLFDLFLKKRPELDQQVQLSNHAFLRIHGVDSGGFDANYLWEARYRPFDSAAWGKAGEWMGNDSGDVLACPLGAVLLIARTDGSRVFVRTEAGSWKDFHMDIPGPSPFRPGELGPNFTSLDLDEIRSVRTRMALTSAEGDLHPFLGQFVPETRELFLDYLTPAKRRFRLHLKLIATGEKFRLADVEEKPFDPNRPFFDQIIPDTPVSAACNKVEFFRR